MADATPTRTLVIQGETFEVTLPYAEGHVLTEVEARVLNQNRCENIRNSQAKAIKEAKENGKFDLKAVVERVAAYDAAYTFAAGGGAVKRTLDPIEKEARAIARNLIANKLRDQGKKMKDQDKGKLAEAVEKWAEHPKVLAAAKKVVKEREDLANISLDAA